MTVHLSAKKIKRCAKYLVLRCINGFMLLFGTILHSLKLLPTASSKHTNDTLFIILVKRISSHSRNDLISLHVKYRYMYTSISYFICLNLSLNYVSLFNLKETMILLNTVPIRIRDRGNKWDLLIYRKVCASI